MNNRIAEIYKSLTTKEKALFATGLMAAVFTLYCIIANPQSWLEIVTNRLTQLQYGK